MRLNFLKPPGIPARLPADLELEIKKLRRCETKDEVLTAAYDLLAQKYRGYRLKTYTRLFDLFDVNVDNMWSKTGFLHCTNMNYLMEILLLGSHKFGEEDVKFCWTLIQFCSPHQYLKVRVDNDKWIHVDVWGNAYGIKFGRYAHGFQSGSMRSIH